ncbi:MAG: alpha/beta fold hydrolase [Caldimonas sp.]
MNPRQDVRFCTAADGTRIAVATIGGGPPLVRASHWLSHVQHDLESPVWQPWLRELSRHHTYVRYDQRGSGLSDRAFAGFSLDVWVRDLETVVDALGLARFPLFGMSQGGAIAIEYIRRHPERVSHLVLVGAYGRGALKREPTPPQRLEAETLVNMIRVGWGSDNAAFREVFTNQFIPGGTPTQHRWWTDLQRLTASAEGAARTLEEFQQVDVMDIAAGLRVPTLVMHSRDDNAVPFDEGRRLAAAIPGARFVALESANHVLLEGEPAWPVFLDALRAFLAPDAAAAQGGRGTDGTTLTQAEAAVLELLARGFDNHAIARQLGKSEKTVRNQVSTIFDKLGVRTRAEAIVHAIGARAPR